MRKVIGFQGACVLSGWRGRGVKRIRRREVSLVRPGKAW